MECAVCAQAASSLWLSARALLSGHGGRSARLGTLLRSAWQALSAQRRRLEFELSYSAHRVMKATEIAVLSDSRVDTEDGGPLDKTEGPWS